MHNDSRKLETTAGNPGTGKKKLFHSDIIPKSFCLGGLRIEVEIDDSLGENLKMVGQADYQNQKIRLDPSITPLQATEQSYIHELVHWIFFMMNENKLRNNERIVDTFAHFLYQALVTAEKYPMRIPYSLENEPEGLDEGHFQPDYDEIPFP